MMAVKSIAESRPSIGLRRVVGAIIATVGYILSPLSWWNDAFVNIPISIATAYVLHILLGVDKLLGFYVGYLASNIVGMFMLFYGGYLLTGSRQSLGKRDVVIGALTSLIYTVIASVVLRFAGLL